MTQKLVSLTHLNRMQQKVLYHFSHISIGSGKHSSPYSTGLFDFFYSIKFQIFFFVGHFSDYEFCLMVGSLYVACHGCLESGFVPSKENSL